eukprot:sb/3476409/
MLRPHFDSRQRHRCPVHTTRVEKHIPAPNDPDNFKTSYQVHYPSLPLSYELSTLEDWFLVTVARSHTHCLQSQAPPPPPTEVHSCKIQPWYAKYEVYGAEFNKLVGKKAFRVVDRNS